MSVRLLAPFAVCLLLAAAPPVPPGAGPLVETTGSATVGGKKIDYTAVAGKIPVKDKTGKSTGYVFFMSYAKKGEDAAARPVTFCFNGGPGSSSVWLHLGAFGPNKVAINDDGTKAVSPPALVQNEFSLLDLTDLVFIDPVGTGYSRADSAENAKLFHGVEEDIHSVGEFVKAYVEKFKRAASPKYVAGESYGTTRASGLAAWLHDRAKIKLDGVILVSAVLDFQTIRATETNELFYSVYLPTYAATAFFHGKLDKKDFPTLQKTVEAARAFADGEYGTFIRKGARASDAEREAVAKKMARLVGISEKSLLTANLRLDPMRFRRELLRDKSMSIGRYDARVIGTAGRGPRGGGGDPSYAAIQEPFTKSAAAYLPDVLKYKSDVRYTILGGLRWEYGPSASNRFLNVAPRLRSTMEKNAALKVFVANGYYDLATPFGGMEHTMAHFGPKPVADRVTMAYYEAGHMMYTVKECHRKLKEDLARFYGSRVIATAAVPAAR